MFTGIVEEQATVVSIEKGESGSRITVQSALDHRETSIGDSIAIDGVCLTVVKYQQGSLSFDLSLETLRRSTLGQSTVGSRVNLERSLKLSGQLGGHFVFGHVDGTATLTQVTAEGSSKRYNFSFPKELAPYLATKGSVSLGGVSLTVGEIEGNEFAVYLLPHTLEQTTLGTLTVGNQVNLEVDMLARYVVSALKAAGKV